MPQLALDFDSATAAFPTAMQLCITGRQETLVYDCFRQGGEYTFDDIQAYCRIRGEMYRETSISARIRDLNRRLASRRLVINYRYARRGSTNTFYRLEATT